MARKTSPRKKSAGKARPKASKAGRPSGYLPEFAKQATKLCELGATNADLADFFGVSINTIANWQTARPEFLAALKAGKVSADDRVERSLYQRAVGYTYYSVKIFCPAGGVPVTVPYREHVPPDTTAQIFWLKNRRRNEWRDVQKHEHTGEDGGPIETREMTDLEVARRIAFLLERGARAAAGKSS